MLVLLACCLEATKILLPPSYRSRVSCANRIYRVAMTTSWANSSSLRRLDAAEMSVILLLKTTCTVGRLIYVATTAHFASSDQCMLLSESEGVMICQKHKQTYGEHQ